MQLSESLKKLIGEDSYDFYRCYKCHRLITAIELAVGLRPPEGKRANVCPCGCLKVMPANMRWFDWFKPRVLVFAYARLRGIA